MKILAIGDVVGKAGLSVLRRRLRDFKREKQADFVIVNGENTAGVGITPDQAEDIFTAGADVITLGNHVWDKRHIIPYLEDSPYILRPANLAPQAPGRGWWIYDCGRHHILVMNLIGRCEMKFGPDNPFLEADRILQQQAGKFDVAVCEIHAAATSEKLAMGFYLDGRCAAVYGTHTHVQTADVRINPKGTGYITDIGMTGPIWSVLGIRVDQSIAMFRGDITEYFQTAEGPCALAGVLFDIDEKTGLCRSAERIYEQVAL